MIESTRFETPFLPAILFVLAAILCGLATRIYIRNLKSRRLFEEPNDRSMHKTPVITGGGWSLLAAVLLLWPTAFWPLEEQNVAMLLCILGLAIVAWADDLQNLPWQPRLFAHGVAVAICMSLLPSDALIFGGFMPMLLERTLIAFGWIWFINLYNFMDGIDGIAGAQTISIGLGYAAVGLMAGFGGEFFGLAIIIAGAASGYLYLNWHPAKIILGDVGSIPIGLIMGGLMVDLALRGQIAAAVILPLYYLCDATLTLLHRIIQQVKFWHPHRQHFYQRAVLGGSTHSEVVLQISMANLLLVALAVWSVRQPAPALVGAVAVVALLLARLQRLAGQAPALGDDAPRGGK